MTDHDYMNIALELARKGAGKTNPNPAVGCVIVKGDHIVGKGWHKKCGGPHAEIFALRQAGLQAKGATLYVTLEPCAHQGRTPPCVDAVIASGVKRVVVAMKDPFPKVRGRSIKKMIAAGINVQVGCLEHRARAINPGFCKWAIEGIPLVTVKTAQTLDGKTATVTGQSKWITSAKTRAHTRQLRDQFDAILVGVNTVLKDDPMLNPALTAKPWTKIVLDSWLRVPPHAKLFENFQTVVATTSKAPLTRITQLEKKGARVIVCPADGNGRVRWDSLLESLGKCGITNLLIEGGAKVIGSALKARAADRIITIVSPKIIGDQRAQSCVDGLNISNVNRAVQVDGMTARQVGGDWIFEGKIRY